MNPPNEDISSIDIGDRCHQAIAYLCLHMAKHSGYTVESMEAMDKDDRQILVTQMSEAAWEMMAVTLYNLLQAIGKTNDFPNLGDWALMNVVDGIQTVTMNIPDTLDEMFKED